MFFDQPTRGLEAFIHQGGISLLFEMFEGTSTIEKPQKTHRKP